MRGDGAGARPRLHAILASTDVVGGRSRDPDRLVVSFSKRRRALWAAMVMAALLASEGLSAAPSISVDGTAEAVSIRAVDAPLRDVLDLLRTRFGLRYRSQSTLDTEKTVTLVASLRQVVVRLLEGYDFVIAGTPTGLEVLIVQQSATANLPMPQVRPALTPPAPLMPSTEDERRERG